MQIYPWTFDEFGVEYFLPSVEALDIGAVKEKTGDPFPVASPVLIHQLLQLLVLFLSPPAFL